MDMRRLPVRQIILLPIVAMLVLLSPASLDAVLPELKSTDIRRALAIVRAREENSWLEKYRRTYPFRAPQSVEKIELATDFTRTLIRARTQKELGNYYTEFRAERDYRGKNHNVVEVIALISLSPQAIPSSFASPFSDYSILLVYTDRQGRPERRSYSGRQILRKLLCGGLECAQPSPERIDGAELKVLLPLAWIDPASDLTVVLNEPDGHSTAALFNLSGLL